MVASQASGTRLLPFSFTTLELGFYPKALHDPKGAAESLVFLCETGSRKKKRGKGKRGVSLSEVRSFCCCFFFPRNLIHHFISLAKLSHTDASST